MPGYFGTERQQRLQRRVDELAEWMRSAPGASNGGRLIGTDDPDAFGWDRIIELLGEDGAFSFRVIPVTDIPALEDRLAAHGFQIMWWNLFRADRSTAMAAVEPILARPLPQGIRALEIAGDPESDLVRATQAFMAANGVTPYNGSMLVGDHGPARTVALLRGDEIVATGHTYRPYSTASRNHKVAWGGLIAVAESERGQGLGRIVNAMVVEGAFERVGGETVQEFVHDTNEPSVRIVEACGLRIDPSVKSGVATRDGERFTR